MPVKQTSLIAFENVIDSGKLKSQKDKIYYVLCLHPEGLTRWEIHSESGTMYSSACARVNSLIQAGEAVCEGFKINDSGERAEVVKALPSRRLERYMVM
jgi:hypothetical protein